MLAVGEGWYRGSFGFARRTAIYGDRIGAIAQLEVDGEVAVATDESWTGGFGAVQSASIYDGTVTDLRLAADVHSVGLLGDEWTAAEIIDHEPSLFEPRLAEPVRAVAELPMRAYEHDGRTILDAGQNIAGWVRLTVRGRSR